VVVGHWGTTPGQNFIYMHLNRVIKKYDLDMFYIAGPGHGGPAIVGNVYLEGTWSEVYPNVTQDEAGLKKLFKQKRWAVLAHQPLAQASEVGLIQPRILQTHVQEPAEQNVVVEHLAEQPIRAHRIQRNEQLALEQPLRWDRRPPGIGV